jgi:hypothetical protein
MKVYIIYRLGDYAVPQAMSLNSSEAEKFMKILQKHDPYINDYWIEEKTLSNKVVEI